MNEHKNGPLNGLLVVDFTMFVSGPSCTQLLRDNGARVIKVETPAGDPTRLAGIFVDKDFSKDFAAFNGGKESITANLKNPADLEFVQNIIRKADILVENYRPGVACKLGIGYDAVKQLNPRLVYASISGFGQNGPISQAPAYDTIVQADSGFMSVTGFPGGRSTRAGTSVADIEAGVYSFASIMLALYNRERTGEGCHIDTAMLDCMLTLLPEPIGEYFVTKQTPVKHGNDNPSIQPFSTFMCQDTEIALCVASPKLYQELLAVIGKLEWLERPEFKFPGELNKNIEQFRQEFEAVLAKDSADSWVKTMHTAGIPCSKVNTIADMTEYEQVWFRKMLIPSGNGTFVGNPVKLSGYPVIDQRPRPPYLGEHNADIATEFSNNK